MKKIRLKCYIKGCRNRVTVYLQAGAAGNEQYACDRYGNILADLRDQVFICKQHQKD